MPDPDGFVQEWLGSSTDCRGPQIDADGNAYNFPGHAPGVREAEESWPAIDCGASRRSSSAVRELFGSDDLFRRAEFLARAPPVPCKVRSAEAFVLRLMERYAARIKHGKRQRQFESPILKQADDTIPMG